MGHDGRNITKSKWLGVSELAEARNRVAAEKKKKKEDKKKKKSSRVQKTKSTPKKTFTKKSQNKVASCEAPVEEVRDSDFESVQSTRKRKASGKAKSFRPKVRKDSPISKGLMDEPTEEEDGSSENTDDMPLSKRRIFVEKGSAAGSVAKKLNIGEGKSVEHLQEHLNMQLADTEPERSRISEGEDIQSSPHIYRDQAVEFLVQLGQKDKDMQVAETDKPSEQIDSMLVNLTLQEEIDRFNQWRAYRVKVESILSKWSSWVEEKTWLIQWTYIIDIEALTRSTYAESIKSIKRE